MKKTSEPRIVFFRDRYYVYHYEDGERKRHALGTSSREIAEEAFEIWKRVHASVPRSNGSPQTARYWLTRRYHAAHSRAKRRDIDISICRGDMDRLFRRAKGRCELTGIPFDLSQPDKGERQPFRMSLDRIDAEQGYHFENCRLVCSAVNFAMGQWGDAALYEMARGLLGMSGRDMIRRVMGGK